MNKSNKIFFSIITAFALTFSFSIGLNVQANAQTANNQPVNQKFFTQSEAMQKLKLQGPNDTVKKLMLKSPEQKSFIKGPDNKQISENAYVTFKQPDSNWNPINASNEELEYYGLPSRPNDPSKLKEWEKTVSSKWVKPEIQNTGRKRPRAQLQKSKIINSQHNNPIWAGYVDKMISSGAAASWQIPYIGYSQPYTYSSQWVGLGGYYYGDALVQAGTGADLYGVTSNYVTWYELLGTDYYTEYEQDISSMPSSPYDNVYTSIKARFFDSPQYVYFDFYISNTTESKYTSFTIAVTKCPGVDDTSEWIGERPTINNIPTSYAKTSSGYGNFVPFWQAQYRDEWGNGSWSTLSNDPNTVNTEIMTGNSGATLAQPGSISSDGSFNVYWYGYN